MSVVFVGMSGGIDSSVATFLLKEKGFKVVGITFLGVEEEGSRKCCSYEEVINAKKVADFLGIEHRVINLKDVFKTKIISYFIESYKAGLTPNPCLLCNRYIKFGALLEYALAEGADFFSTGHYAKIEETNGELLIRRGKDRIKDQSYFISYIEREKLPYIKLPLGNYNKSEVREINRIARLPVESNRPESQDICFVPDDYRKFLENNEVKGRPGNFIYEGKNIGMHRGIPFYCYGQRRGLGIALGKRVFVRKLDVNRNEIHLGEKPFSKEFCVRDLNIFTESFVEDVYDIQVRYQSPVEKGKVLFKDNKVYVTLEKPRELVTPGQFAVFYKNDFVYASGIIDEVILMD